MIRAVQLAGPWAGVATAASPHRIGQGQISDGRNVFFHEGRLVAAPPWVALGPQPTEIIYNVSDDVYTLFVDLPGTFVVTGQNIWFHHYQGTGPG